MQHLRRVSLVLALIAMVALPSFAGPSINAQDRVIQVPIENTEMQAAIEAARKSLPEFWAAFDARRAGEEGYSLKVAITDGKKIEHFWLNEIERKAGIVTGVINNDPNDVSTVKLGDRVEIPNDRISDWMFLRNGKIVGNATLRVLMKFMASEQAERYRIMLEKP